MFTVLSRNTCSQTPSNKENQNIIFHLRMKLVEDLAHQKRSSSPKKKGQMGQTDISFLKYHSQFKGNVHPRIQHKESLKLFLRPRSRKYVFRSNSVLGIKLGPLSHWRFTHFLPGVETVVEGKCWVDGTCQPRGEFIIF